MVEGYYPKTLMEALYLRRNDPDTLLIAGGTDAMVVKKTAPKTIFINQIPELQEVSKSTETLTIGACAVYSDLLSNPLVPDVLKQAIRKIASPAIRNAGTIGGNLCNASPAGDTLPVLYALSAQIVIASLSNEDEIITKRLPITEFIQGVRKIALASNEMVIALEFPVAAYEGMTKIVYEKVGARQADAISKLSFVGLMKVDDDIIEEIRIAFGSVAITTVRREDLEHNLCNITLPQLQAMKPEILRSYAEYIRPIDDQRSTAVYRKKVCLNLLEDFLTV